MALPFEASPPVSGMEKPILIGSAAPAAPVPAMPAKSASAAAVHQRRTVVMSNIGFTP
jgi:hypothetical protein